MSSLEFTDKFSRGKGFVSGNHKFDVECKADKIEHRLTAPYTPQTNKMVKRVNETKSKQRSIKILMILNPKYLRFYQIYSKILLLKWYNAMKLDILNKTNQYYQKMKYNYFSKNSYIPF